MTGPWMRRGGEWAGVRKGHVLDVGYCQVLALVLGGDLVDAHSIIKNN